MGDRPWIVHIFQRLGKGFCLNSFPLNLMQSHFFIAARQVIPRHWKMAMPSMMTQWHEALSSILHMEQMISREKDKWDRFQSIWLPWILFKDTPAFQHHMTGWDLNPARTTWSCILIEYHPPPLPPFAIPHWSHYPSYSLSPPPPPLSVNPYLPCFSNRYSSTFYTKLEQSVAKHSIITEV